MWFLMKTRRESRATAVQSTGPRYVTAAASDCISSIGEVWHTRDNRLMSFTCPTALYKLVVIQTAEALGQHSDSEKNIPIRFDFLKRIDFFDSIRFDSAHRCRIGVQASIVYYVVKCQLYSVIMSHSHNFTKTSAVTSAITTGRMIIDQANAAAASNGRCFNKTNRFESIRPNESANRFESRIGML